MLPSEILKTALKKIPKANPNEVKAKRTQRLFYIAHNRRYYIIMTSETDYHQFELKDQKRPIRPKLLKLTDDGRSRKKSKFKVIEE